MRNIATFGEYLCFVEEVFFRILTQNRTAGNTCMELAKFQRRAAKETFAKESDIPKYLRFFEKDIVVSNGLVGFLSDFQNDIVIHQKVISRLRRRSLHINGKTNRSLHENQRRAVKEAPSSDISIITGGAGTGKTTIINQILHDFNRTYQGKKNAFVLAPTGKAARRAKETIVEPCSISTVHYFAGWGHPLNRRDYQRIASADFIIVDESSMLSAEMFCLLMQITDAPIILVGDINQLPAVEAGNILKDLIDLGVPAYYLTENFRSDSDILVNANAFLDVTQDFRGLITSECFQLIKIKEEDATRVLANVDADVVLTPFRREDFEGSCTSINQLVHQSRGFQNGLYHVGEPVILKKNNTKLGYANGETGYVTAVSLDAIYIDLGDRTVALKDENELELNYACTIHKSQGSEYDSIAIYCPNSPLITKNTLYTAITRAKHLVQIYYTEDSVFEAAFRRNAYERSTFLSAMAA